MEIKGPQDLEKEVINTGLCTLCGACVGLCPYFRAYQGKVVVMDNCNLSQGRCYSFCPRTPSNLDEVNQALYGTSYPGDALGTSHLGSGSKSRFRSLASRKGKE